MRAGHTSSVEGVPVYSFQLTKGGRRALMTGLSSNVVAGVANIKMIVQGLLKVFTVPWNCMNG